MILIISQSHSEHSTDSIIDWIDYSNISFERINGIDFYKGVKINLNNDKPSVQIDSVSLDKIKVVWFRRWMAKENSKNVLVDNKDKDNLKSSINKFLKDEFKELTTFFFDWLPKDILFDRIFDNEINKLSILLKAIEFDIKIPETFIGTTRYDFEKRLKEKDLIVKAISNAPAFNIERKTYVGYTKFVKEIPQEIGDVFAPSLVQNLVEKKYEIRAFLLSDTFYSMAIFSQNDEQTSLDFRMYNWQNPNRMVPFKLPITIEVKLLKLAKHFQLNTCSFDLIKTVDNQYIFLEVNPGGQFGMVSYPCNYFLEKRIANELINHCT